MDPTPAPHPPAPPQRSWPPGPPAPSPAAPGAPRPPGQPGAPGTSWAPAHAQQPWQRRSRLPSGAELLGWGGALTTIVGVVAVTWDVWSAVDGLVLALLLAAATAVLGVAAAVVGDLDRDHDDRLAANLSTGLWWATGISCTTTSFVAADAVSGGRPNLALLAAALAATAMCAAAARRSGSQGPLAGVVAGSATAAFAAAGLAGAEGGDRALAVWLVGAGAVALLSAWRRTAGVESRAAFAAAVVVLFASAQAVLWVEPPGAAAAVVLVGSVAAAGAAAWGRRTEEAVVTAALAGVVTCQVLYRLVPQAFGLSTTILVAGVAMTAGCAVLVRRSRRGDQG